MQSMGRYTILTGVLSCLLAIFSSKARSVSQSFSGSSTTQEVVVDVTANQQQQQEQHQKANLQEVWNPSNKSFDLTATATATAANDEQRIIAEATYQKASPGTTRDMATEAPTLSQEEDENEDDDDTGADLGTPQQIDDANQGAAVQRRIQEARTYVTTVVQQDPSLESVRSICENQHELCAFWAVLGECDKNPSYMKLNCAPVCQSCEMLDINKRCPLDPNAVDVLTKPGDLDQVFTRLLTTPEYQMYHPRAVSHPAGFSFDTDDDDTLSNGPWMVMMDDIVSPEEAWRLRELGAAQGYKRSEDVGHKKADGTFTSYSNSGRTSTNSWCVDNCYSDPVAQRVMERIANLTGIPETNSENLQLLRYEEGQFYQTHSDYINFQLERQTGVRILTFYIYLNDVEEGGGTNFPHLNLTVAPKLGRAVLWPSVLNDHPNVQDSRTEHQALPVIRGVKYGANAWLHQRNYKGPNEQGC